jgi:chemotaxis protein methyltransferase CheR
MRKIELRLSETRSKDYEEYFSYITSKPGEVDQFINALSINASNFFRNPFIYELLAATVLPDLISEFRFLKIWSIGCSRGEEPYSLAILINDLLKRELDFFNVKIIGSDINSDAIEKAKAGQYSDSELGEVKKKYMDTCFQQISEPRRPYEKERTYRIKDEIKSMVDLSCSDLIRDLRSKKSPSEGYHIILCRNVLIYMDRGLQEQILKSLSDIIYENGYLVLGATDMIPDTLKNKFLHICPGVKIFKKIVSQ